MKQWLILLTLLLLLSCSGNDTQTAVSPNTPTGLTGALTYMQVEPGQISIQEHTLTNNNKTTLFTMPKNGWLSTAVASPDGSQLLMAYAPPPAVGEVQFGYTKLYTMLRETNAVPRPLMNNTLPDESFFNPVWAPDGRFIIYSHVSPDSTDPNGFVTTLERMDLATGETAVLAFNAIWPTLSADGTQLAYVTSDPLTLEETLILAAADGSNAIPLISPNYFPAVDMLLFTPDNRYLYFSVAESELTAQAWWEQLLAIQIAAAHNVPSNWWRIELPNGQPEQLTSTNRIGLFGTFTPDGSTLITASNDGLHILDPEGPEQQQLSNAFTFSVSYINDGL